MNGSSVQDQNNHSSGSGMRVVTAAQKANQS